MHWFGAIIAISALIIVHETGHYLVAKWCGMRVERFSLGFGPGILTRKYKGTIFQIAPVPFGGFVEIRGMNLAEEVDPHDKLAYPNRPAWQRFLTIFAGPATNYIFAIFLAFIVFSSAGVPGGLECLVGEVNDGFDAVGKLEKGDKIVAVDGVEIYTSWTGRTFEPGLPKLIDDAGTNPVDILIERDGERMNVSVTPTLDDKTGRHRLGIGLDLTEYRQDIGVIEATGHAFYYPVAETKNIVKDLYSVIRGEQEGEAVGPVGIATVIKRAFEVGWITVLKLLMILNVYLGLFNLFPLPALDGGRLVFLTYEMATRRRANPKIETMVHMVGIMLLMLLMVVVTFKDCSRLL